jgi:hypothetical protein
MVMLGMQEHKVVFTKDISKFYQCVEADEAAQHVRRILWRFGNGKVEPTIFVTTRVNYGDKPAGCIAMAVVRETTERFGEGIWKDMEDILENGGFRFKETVMTGDPLGEAGELTKVLGLRWGTEQDEICVDVKLNYGEKVKGAYTDEDAPLTDLESALPSWVTRRILWRVAQSQYDPLGLHSVYKVKWKLLMRKVMLKGKTGKVPWTKKRKENSGNCSGT